MKKEARYNKGQSILLEDDSVIILKERWDTRIIKKNQQSEEVTWLAYRVNNPSKIFVIKETEIPDQE